MTPPRTLEEPQSDWARSRAYRWWMDWFGGIKEFTHDTLGINQVAAMLREAADVARQEEREALRSEFGDFMDETIDWLLRMNRTADPGTDEPKNFEPDLRTRAAIAAWLMDSRKPILLAWLDARSRAEEPKP